MKAWNETATRAVLSEKRTLWSLGKQKQISMAENRHAKQRVASVAGDLADSAVADSANRAAKTADSFLDALRETIESQPYTAVIIAFGLGWLWGRMHRPF
jgi:hypothetical protein